MKALTAMLSHSAPAFPWLMLRQSLFSIETFTACLTISNMELLSEMRISVCTPETNGR
jgi:hypothetical protein